MSHSAIEFSFLFIPEIIEETVKKIPQVFGIFASFQFKWKLRLFLICNMLSLNSGTTDFCKPLQALETFEMSLRCLE